MAPTVPSLHTMKLHRATELIREVARARREPSVPLRLSAAIGEIEQVIQTIEDQRAKSIVTLPGVRRPIE